MTSHRESSATSDRKYGHGRCQGDMAKICSAYTPVEEDVRGSGNTIPDKGPYDLI
jgi:hypothetical protein